MDRKELLIRLRILAEEGLKSKDPSVRQSTVVLGALIDVLNRNALTLSDFAHLSRAFEAEHCHGQQMYG